MTLRSQLVTELDRQKTPAVEDVIVEHDGRVGEDDVAASADTVVVRVHLLEVVDVWDTAVLGFSSEGTVATVRDVQPQSRIESAAISTRLTSGDDSLNAEVLHSQIRPMPALRASLASRIDHDFNASSTSVAST